MRFVVALFWGIATCVMLPAISLAKDGKHALVIGNAAYTHASVLRNPVRDSRAMRSALRKLGFEVEYGQDLTWGQTQQIVSGFLTKAKNAKIALFYYAGHGIQLRGQNFIIPTDANFLAPGELDQKIVSMNDIFRHIDKRSDTGLVFLDACRDNPFREQIQTSLINGQAQLSRSMGRIRLKRGLELVDVADEPAGEGYAPDEPATSAGTQSLQLSGVSIGLGLAEIDGGEGMFVAYATRPGQVALDGQGRHSPFTEGLLKYLRKPGLEIRQVLTRVRKHVRQQTKGRQTPWDSSSLVDDFYLASLQPDVLIAPNRPEGGKLRKKKRNKKRVGVKKRKSKVRVSRNRNQKKSKSRAQNKRPTKKRNRMFLP